MSGEAKQGEIPSAAYRIGRTPEGKHMTVAGPRERGQTGDAFKWLGLRSAKDSYQGVASAMPQNCHMANTMIGCL